MNRRNFNKFAAAAALAGWVGQASAIAEPPDNRADPADWNLWRCGPISFPNFMLPEVPELAADGIIDLGRAGADLVVVMPETIAATGDGRALQAMLRMMRAKVPNAAFVNAESLSPAQRESHLLLVGSLQKNSMARSILAQQASAIAAGIAPGGYHLKVLPNPYHPARRAIFAIGGDAVGAWNVAALLAYSIHPEKAASTLSPWPFQLPSNSYWASFEAKYAPGRALPAGVAASSSPVPPRIPFGVRIWGSPMPTLESFARLLEGLKPLGIDTIAIQGGGWPDLADGPQLYRKAVDMAWRQGIFSIIYVGNDMVSHKPAPLTAIHRAIVAAVKDHPGLLQWHLYNQLSADLTPDEYRMVEDQMRWLTGISNKPVGVEVVWGHDAATIPPEKIRLIEDLKRWGMTVLANDDAPIGGWSKRHDVSIWEPRLLNLRPFGMPVIAVLQAHVPFVKPTVPTAAEVRSQFWWTVAGGARGFLFETAYLFTDASMRGLLSWDLQPLPDGRYDEVRRLAGIARALRPVLEDTEPMPGGAEEQVGVTVDSQSQVALRVRRSGAGELYVLLINRSTGAAASVRLSLPKNVFTVRELAPGQSIQESASESCVVQIAAGGGACLHLQQSAARP